MRVAENDGIYLQIHCHPLFQTTSESTFRDFMERCHLEYYETGQRIPYAKRDDRGLLLILTGVAEVFIERQLGRRAVLEMLVNGGLIGFASISRLLHETVEVGNHWPDIAIEAAEEVLCLRIPDRVLRERWQDDDVRNFLLTQMAVKFCDIYGAFAEQVKLANDWGESEAFIRRVQDLMKYPVLTATADDTVQNIAQVMVAHAVSSVVIVDRLQRLVGIVTEQDLVKRVLVRGNPEGLCAEDVMTPNPYTIDRNAYYYEALSVFYGNGIKHLPVVDDNGCPVGIITLSGLLAKKQRGTMGILKTIESSTADDLPMVKEAVYDVLSSLIKDQITAVHTLEIITRFYDRLARHCVGLAERVLESQGWGKPPAAYAWYQMGSSGRGEQFMLTDQDHFLVYQDESKKSGESGKDDGKVASYFALLGTTIVQILEQAGYHRCKGLMMSSEVHWRGSLSDWQLRLKNWALKLTDEDILLAHNFFSFRYLYGSVDLHKEFVTMVQKQMDVSKTLLYLMAQQEREHPVPQLEPSLLRFKQRRETIDVKKHMLFPFHHCLQILGVHYRVMKDTPMAVLAELVKIGVIDEVGAEELRHAYEIALRTRILMSWNNHRHGGEDTTEIAFATMRSWEREEIVTALKSIRGLQFRVLKML